MSKGRARGAGNWTRPGKERKERVQSTPSFTKESSLAALLPSFAPSFSFLSAQDQLLQPAGALADLHNHLLPGRGGARRTKERVRERGFSAQKVMARFLLALTPPALTLSTSSSQVMTDMYYPVYPEGLYNAIVRSSKYGIPMYITETGIADKRDDRRAMMINQYWEAVSVRGW